MNSQIRALLDKLAVELEVAVKRAVLDAVTSALGAPRLNDPAVELERPLGVYIDEPAPMAAKSLGRKRDPKALAALTEIVAVRIAQHPDSSIEQLGAMLRRTTKELTLPIQKLLVAKRIGRKGQKRATRYFPLKAKKK